MTDFYKVENGALVKFKDKYIKFNDKVYSNPTDEQLKAAGWKTLIKTEKPEDGEDYYYIASYDDSGEEIFQYWVEQKIVFEFDFPPEIYYGEEIQDNI